MVTSLPPAWPPKSLPSLQSPCISGALGDLLWALPGAPFFPSTLVTLDFPVLSFKRPCPALVQGGPLLLQCPSPQTSKSQGAQEAGKGGGRDAHIFVQVCLLQIHDLELQPLEDLFQGLAGLVVELFTWEGTERRACMCELTSVCGGGLGANRGSRPPEGRRALTPTSLRLSSSGGTH